MEAQNQTSVIDVSRKLLEALNSGGPEEMKTSLKDLKDQVIGHLNDDPIRTIGVAFTLGFVATKMMRLSGHGLQKKIAQAVGSAFVYGLVNPMLKTGMNSANDQLH